MLHRQITLFKWILTNYYTYRKKVTNNTGTTSIGILHEITKFIVIYSPCFGSYPFFTMTLSGLGGSGGAEVVGLPIVGGGGGGFTDVGASSSLSELEESSSMSWTYNQLNMLLYIMTRLKKVTTFGTFPLDLTVENVILNRIQLYFQYTWT